MILASGISAVIKTRSFAEIIHILIYPAAAGNQFQNPAYI
jgi:hypothetical protein